MAKQVMAQAKREYDERVLEALDAYRPEIEARRSGYLRDIQKDLQIVDGIYTNYVALSLLVKRYRTEHDIETVNKRKEHRERMQQRMSDAP
jgi:hypothetical protein